jgi:hypothetical protein
MKRSIEQRLCAYPHSVVMNPKSLRSLPLNRSELQPELFGIIRYYSIKPDIIGHPHGGGRGQTVVRVPRPGVSKERRTR